MTNSRTHTADGIELPLNSSGNLVPWGVGIIAFVVTIAVGMSVSNVLGLRIDATASTAVAADARAAQASQGVVTANTNIEGLRRQADEANAAAAAARAQADADRARVRSLRQSVRRLERRVVVVERAQTDGDPHGVVTPGQPTVHARGND